MTLRIQHVEARIVDHPVRSEGTIVSFLGRHEASHYVTVTVTDADGARGFGEAATAPVRASIGAYPPAETVRLAVEFWEAGVRTLKFKTGKPGIDDAARLRAVRDRLGAAPVFTIDANGAYATADEAVAAIEELLPYDLSLIEQPTPRDRIGLLAEVRRRVPVPILADECVFTPGQLEEAIDRDAFDVLSIYPGIERWFHAFAGHGAAGAGGGKDLRHRLQPGNRPRTGRDGLPGR